MSGRIRTTKSEAWTTPGSISVATETMHNSGGNSGTGLRWAVRKSLIASAGTDFMNPYADKMKNISYT